MTKHEGIKPDLEALAKDDYILKSQLRDKETKYYQEKMEELGLQSMTRFVAYHPNPSKYMRLGITYAHRDLESVAEAMAHGKPWAVVSGLNPSGALHFGHKAVFDELLWMQQQGADVYIPVTNDESYLVGKSPSLRDARNMAYDSVIPTILAMGFDSKKTHVFVDSDYPDIYNVAMDVAKNLTLNKVSKVFGFNKDENPGIVFYRSAVQVAQILLPQYKEFGGPKPTLVPVGIDQYPYILLAREVARKKGFTPPSGLFLKFLWGLDGKGKMSTSRQGSPLFLTEDLKKTKKLLNSSYTGGSPSGNFQEQNGGIPEICPIYTMRTYHLEEEDTIKEECSSGKILCGTCKQETIEKTVAHLKEYQPEIEKARKTMEPFILKVPIRSILE